MINNTKLSKQYLDNLKSYQMIDDKIDIYREFFIGIIYDTPEDIQKRYQNITNTELVEYCIMAQTDVEIEYNKAKEYQDIYIGDPDGTLFTKILLESLLDVDLVTDGKPTAGTEVYFDVLKKTAIQGRVEYLYSILLLSEHALVILYSSVNDKFMQEIKDED